MSYRYSLFKFWVNGLSEGAQLIGMGAYSVLVGLAMVTVGAIRRVCWAWRINRKYAGDEQFWDDEKDWHALGMIVERKDKQ